MENLLPGFIQGITRVTVTYPFETIKTHMQNNNYNTFRQASSDIIYNNPRLLYRGSLVSYIILPMDRSFQYYFLEKYKNQYNCYMLGIFVGMISCVYNVPASYICTNLVLQKKECYSISQMIRNKNISYKGFLAESARTMTATPIYLGTYFYLRENYNKNQNLYISSFIGGISGMMCWIISFPFDTIRTEMQTSNEKSLIKTIKLRYSKYGFLNFYKGITPVMMRILPSNILSMYSYEKSRNFFCK